MESFENGSIVALRQPLPGSEGKYTYASTRSNPFTNHGVGMALIGREHCETWEKFRLKKHRNGTISLQNMGGGYLSPASDVEDWTFRGWCDRWEHLHVEARFNKMNDTLTSHFRLFSDKGGGTNVYLSLNSCTAHLLLDREKEDSQTWEIILADVPKLNIYSIDRQGICKAENLHSLDIESRTFVLKVLRAMKELGAFRVIGHRGSQDLLDICKQEAGELVWKDLSEDSSDSTFKMNHALMDCRRGVESVGTYVSSLPAYAHQTVVERFWFCEDLANVLLHALALANMAACPTHVDRVHQWRGAWRDEHRYMGLRLLLYHPGPMRDANGKRVVTTSRHTDATWLTILDTDNCEGLEIFSVPLHKWISATNRDDSGLLVNTGNALKTATQIPEEQAFYPAVCHRVRRTESSMKRTRISIPFFYDRSSSGSFHGGGTGGC